MDNLKKENSLNNRLVARNLQGDIYLLEDLKMAIAAVKNLRSVVYCFLSNQTNRKSPEHFLKGLQKSKNPRLFDN